MASRREIREAAVQFLYCADIEGTTQKENLYKTFWHIVLESDQKKLRKASAKALLHLNQGRSARHVKLVERAPEAEAQLKLDDNASKLLSLFKKIVQREGKWQALCDSISRLLKSDMDSAVEELEDALDELYTLNHVLINFRKEWNQQLLDFPKLKNQLEAVNAQMTALDRIGQRLLMVEEPENYPEQTDIAHLRDSAAKLADYRDAVDVFVSGVLDHKEDIDQAISKVVENYDPARIDPVDRAAIRLSAFEILKTDVPAPVAINEAIEIVKKFGSNESARFTNGILDSIAKNIEKTS